MSHLTLESRAARPRTLRNVIGQRYYGILAAMTGLRDRIYEVPGRFFDARHGVETGGMIQIPDLIIPEDARPQAARYQPTKPAVFSHLLRRLPVGDRSRFAFVDYGCGKGRCLLLAARAGFGQVVGVELSEPLCAAAAKNTAAFMDGRFASRIKVECTHSARAVLPEQPSVYYFYNPFGAEAMSETIGSIAAHLERTGDQAYAVYVNPMHGSVIAEGGFRLIESGTRRSEDWAIWHRPAAFAKAEPSGNAA